MFNKIFVIILILTNIYILAMDVKDLQLERHPKRKEIEKKIDDENETKLKPAKKKPRIVPSDIKIDLETSEKEPIKFSKDNNFAENTLVTLASKKVAIKAAQIYDQEGFDRFNNYLEKLLDGPKIIVLDLLINDLDRSDIFINKIKEFDNSCLEDSYAEELPILLALDNLLSEIDSQNHKEENNKSFLYCKLQDLFTSDDRKFCLKQLLNILKQKIAQYHANQAVNAVDAELKDTDAIMEEVASAEKPVNIKTETYKGQLHDLMNQLEQIKDGFNGIINDASTNNWTERELFLAINSFFNIIEATPELRPLINISLYRISIVEFLAMRLNRPVLELAKILNTNITTKFALEDYPVLENNNSIVPAKHETGPINPTYKERYACNVEGCNASFKSNSSLYDHKKSAHGDGFKCNLEGCNESFRHRSQLSNHKKSVHRGGFKCNFEGCNKSFKSPYGLRYHKMHKHG